MSGSGTGFGLGATVVVDGAGSVVVVGAVVVVGFTVVVVVVVVVVVAGVGVVVLISTGGIVTDWVVFSASSVDGGCSDCASHSANPSSSSRQMVAFRSKCILVVVPVTTPNMFMREQMMMHQLMHCATLRL